MYPESLIFFSPFRTAVETRGVSHGGGLVSVSPRFFNKQRVHCLQRYTQRPSSRKNWHGTMARATVGRGAGAARLAAAYGSVQDGLQERSKGGRITSLREVMGGNPSVVLVPGTTDARTVRVWMGKVVEPLLRRMARATGTKWMAYDRAGEPLMSLDHEVARLVEDKSTVTGLVAWAAADRPQWYPLLAAPEFFVRNSLNEHSARLAIGLWTEDLSRVLTAVWSGSRGRGFSLLSSPFRPLSAYECHVHNQKLAAAGVKLIQPDDQGVSALLELSGGSTLAACDATATGLHGMQQCVCAELGGYSAPDAIQRLREAFPDALAAIFLPTRLRPVEAWGFTVVPGIYSSLGDLADAVLYTLRRARDAKGRPLASRVLLLPSDTTDLPNVPAVGGFCLATQTSYAYGNVARLLMKLAATGPADEPSPTDSHARDGAHDAPIALASLRSAAATIWAILGEGEGSVSLAPLDAQTFRSPDVSATGAVARAVSLATSEETADPASLAHVRAWFCTLYGDARPPKDSWAPLITAVGAASAVGRLSDPLAFAMLPAASQQAWPQVLRHVLCNDDNAWVVFLLWKRTALLGSSDPAGTRVTADTAKDFFAAAGDPAPPRARGITVPFHPPSRQEALQYLVGVGPGVFPYLQIRNTVQDGSHFSELPDMVPLNSTIVSRFFTGSRYHDMDVNAAGLRAAMGMVVSACSPTSPCVCDVAACTLGLPLFYGIRLRKAAAVRKEIQRLKAAMSHLSNVLRSAAAILAVKPTVGDLDRNTYRSLGTQSPSDALAECIRLGLSDEVPGLPSSGTATARSRPALRPPPTVLYRVYGRYDTSTQRSVYNSTPCTYTVKAVNLLSATPGVRVEILEIKDVASAYLTMANTPPKDHVTVPVVWRRFLQYQDSEEWEYFGGCDKVVAAHQAGTLLQRDKPFEPSPAAVQAAKDEKPRQGSLAAQRVRAQVAAMDQGPKTKAGLSAAGLTSVPPAGLRFPVEQVIDWAGQPARVLGDPEFDAALEEFMDAHGDNDLTRVGSIRTPHSDAPGRTRLGLVLNSS